VGGEGDPFFIVRVERGGSLSLLEEREGTNLRREGEKLFGRKGESRGVTGSILMRRKLVESSKLIAAWIWHLAEKKGSSQLIVLGVQACGIFAYKEGRIKWKSHN